MVARARDVASVPVATARSVVGGVRRRWRGAYEVDPWGFDGDVHAAMARLVAVRWSVSIGGLPHLPSSGPALLVANQRLGSLSPLAAVLEIGRAHGRPIRFTGVPDVEPLTSTLRRLGGVLDRPDEVAGLLRAGELALVWCETLLRAGGRVGRVAPEHLRAALEQSAPVLPVAIHGRRVGRLLRVEIGAPLARRPRRVSQLAAVEAADAAREGVQTLLDEATPPSWPYR